MYHLAQLNVGRILAPLEDERMSGFMELLEEVNAIAEASDGFVWRLTGAGDDATDIKAFEDEMLLINMSVWETPDALREFTYRSPHRLPLRRRREWFAPMGQAHLVLWWVPAGHVPTIAEAVERLECLRTNGPTAEAFDLRVTFPAPQAV